MTITRLERSAATLHCSFFVGGNGLCRTAGWEGKTSCYPGFRLIIESLSTVVTEWPYLCLVNKFCL